MTATTTKTRPNSVCQITPLQWLVNQQLMTGVTKQKQLLLVKVTKLDPYDVPLVFVKFYFIDIFLLCYVL